jgi:hypothetical protein
LAGNIFRADVDVCGPRCTAFAVVDIQVSIGMADAPIADRRSPTTRPAAYLRSSHNPFRKREVVTFASLGKRILSATVA